MGYIGPSPNPGQNREVDDISSGFNGNATAFTLQVGGANVSPGSSNAIIVSLGGVVQNPGTDYTVAASTLTFTTAPASGLAFFGLVLGQQVDTEGTADDSITTSKIADNAVTTAKIADSTGASDGVTTAKIATSAITTAKIADQAVDLSKLPHGTGSNDGKFLRANNGADPTFETVSGTTINNNADNRVITGSGTANTLEGEANLTYTGDVFEVTDSSNQSRFKAGKSSDGNNDTRVLIGNGTTNCHCDLFLGAHSTESIFIKFGDSGDADKGIIQYHNLSNFMAFTTNTNERMRIFSNGNVGIGINANVTEKFDVQQSSTSAGAGRFFCNSTSFTGHVLEVTCNRDSTGGVYNFIKCIKEGIAEQLRIADNGNVKNTNNSYGSISDVILKENIVDANSQWDDIKNIRIRKFNFIEKTDPSKKTMLGVVAQEAELICPNLVDSEVSLQGGEEKEYKSFNYSVLYMKAVKALQEAMTRIETLETKVAALEAA